MSQVRVFSLLQCDLNHTMNLFSYSMWHSMSTTLNIIKGCMQHCYLIELHGKNQKVFFCIAMWFESHNEPNQLLMWHSMSTTLNINKGCVQHHYLVELHGKTVKSFLQCDLNLTISLMSYSCLNVTYMNLDMVKIRSAVENIRVIHLYRLL